jgi:hypothetical protein
MSDLISDGMTKVVWASSISNINAPTTTELNAGSDFTTRITPDGLKIDPSTADVDTSSLASHLRHQDRRQDRLRRRGDLQARHHRR